ncbi:hypothetical protein M5362_32460 [Streptomyces sp. Je 1-79]|uniref:hypothetical protein n=1 Tax=Streptomyces sp. Je 1-79 TaxID=2943847 RepID=UPI0021A6AEDB|nr:hypothetical protein [Streptomyces sp. Je 1-79]MCT4357820.1 hypothetical protein [Streptomyces sp. Je 1-79]
MDGDEASAVHRLFGPDTVILAEPRRSVLRRYHGPKMHMAAEDGTVLAHLHERASFAYVLQDLDNRHVLGVDLISGKAALARPRFRLTAAAGDPIGEVHTPGRVNHTRLLDIRTAGAGTLQLTRNALLGRAWLVRDDLDGVIAEVTVSTVRSMDGLQGYTVEFDRRAGSEQRRLVVGATVCLQVIRRWLNGPQGNAG